MKNSIILIAPTLPILAWMAWLVCYLVMWAEGIHVVKPLTAYILLTFSLAFCVVISAWIAAITEGGE